MPRASKCPICHKTAQSPVAGERSSFPFCSERCRQVDLLRWSKGQYAIVEPLHPDQIEDDAGADYAAAAGD